MDGDVKTYNLWCFTEGCDQYGSQQITTDRDLYKDCDDMDFVNDVCDSCNERLKVLGHVGPTVMEDSKTRYHKNAAYLKERARKHAQSPDQKELKRKRFEQETGMKANKNL